MWFFVLILLMVPVTYAEESLKLCSLVTADEIHDAVGIKVGSGTEDSVGELRQCSWAGSMEGDLSLILSFQKGGQRTCDKRWHGEKDLGRRVEDLTGFGDKAWWSYQRKDPSLAIVAMNVCSPKGILRVSLWGGEAEEAAMKKMAEDLARKAFDRL